MADHELQAPLPSQFHQLLALRCGGGHGLFYEGVLAREQALFRKLIVGIDMGCYRHRVDIGIIQNIISFAHINTWWETLVKATIIVLALAAPGVLNLIRRRRS